MPVYKDNAQNRKLNRVGKSWGKEEKKKAPPKKKSAPKKRPSSPKSVPYSPSLMGGSYGAETDDDREKQLDLQFLKFAADHPFAIDGRVQEEELPEDFVPIYEAGFDEEWNPVLPNMLPILEVKNKPDRRPLKRRPR